MVRIDVKAVTEQVTNSNTNNNNVVVVQNICVDRSWNRDRFCGIFLTIITTKVPPNQLALDYTLFVYAPKWRRMLEEQKDIHRGSRGSPSNNGTNRNRVYHFFAAKDSNTSSIQHSNRIRRWRQHMRQ